LGARLFEKHFTFSHSARGTDHGFSLEPAGLAKYVTDLQRTAEAMGNGVKRPLECERKPLTKLGKALYFGRDMRAGDTIYEADIAIKSPSGPLPPYVLPEVIGRELLRDVTRDEAVSADSLK
jgi:sialic acid synthase SpsE